MNLIESSGTDPLLEQIDERLKIKYMSVAGQSESKPKRSLKDLHSSMDRRKGVAVESLASIQLMVVGYEIRDRMMYLYLSDFTEVVEISCLDNLFEKKTGLLNDYQPNQDADYNMFYHTINDDEVFSYSGFGKIKLMVGNILSLSNLELTVLNEKLFGIIDQQSLSRVIE